LKVTNTGTGNSLLVEDSANPDSTPFVVTAAGDVGIGTSAPAERLHVTDVDETGFAGISVQNNNSNLGIAGIDFGSDSTYRKAAIGQLRQSPNGNGPLVFYVDSNTDAENWAPADEKMRIMPTGNVGIGTSSPAAKLDVSGNVQATTTATGSIGFYVNNGTQSSGLSADFNANNSYLDSQATLVFRDVDASYAERMRISSTGNVGIGTSNPSSTLDVNGLLTIETTTEVLNTGTIASNVFTADFATGGVFYITTAPAANFTINVTNLPTTDNRVTVVSVFVIQGATGYIPNALQIGGSAQTIKWPGGVAPTATSGAGKVDVFTFTLIRRGAAWEVLGTSDRNY
jgi:hypothetical protein